MGGAFVPAVSTVARWFSKRRTIMTGVVLAGGSLGVLIAPPVANWLISIYEWRLSYIILSIIAFVVIVLFAQFLKRDPSRVGQLPYGVSIEREQESDLGMQGLTLKEAIETKQFWITCVIICCYGFCAYSTMVHIVPHVTDLGITATTAANILATVGAANLVGRIVFWFCRWWLCLFRVTYGSMAVWFKVTRSHYGVHFTGIFTWCFSWPSSGRLYI